MHAVTRAVLGMTLVACALGGAHAQEAPPPQNYAPPPPQYYAPPPPQYYAPPPQYYAPPPALTLDPVTLERAGHRKKVIGAVLMGVGLGVGAIGLGFAVDGAAHSQCHGHEEHATCTPSSSVTEAQLGGAAAALGNVMAIVGIPIYVVGSVQVARARRLAAAALTVQPLVSSAGGGAVASFGARF